jgi:WD40 repeat protein
VAFSADGKWILSGCGNQEVSELQQGNPDWTVRLWDVKSGKELRRFEGHKGLVFRVALSPDGRRAVSGSFDGTVRVWDIQKGRQSWCFTDHTGWVTAVAYSPDGKQAVSGGKDKTIRLWSLPK